MKRQQQCFTSQLTTHNTYIRRPSQCSMRISWAMAKNMGQQSENMGDTGHLLVACFRYHKCTWLWFPPQTIKHTSLQLTAARQMLSRGVFTHKKSSYQWQPAWCLHKCHISVQIYGCTTQMKLFQMLYNTTVKKLSTARIYTAVITVKGHSRSLVMEVFRTVDTVWQYLTIVTMTLCWYCTRDRLWPSIVL